MFCKQFYNITPFSSSNLVFPGYINFIFNNKFDDFLSSFPSGWILCFRGERYFVPVSKSREGFSQIS
jgi:hypothetical protein